MGHLLFIYLDAASLFSVGCTRVAESMSYPI